MADAAIHGHDHHGKKNFFTRWFMSTNHKDIGILYLFTGGLVVLISVIFTVYMRMELMNPGVQHVRGRDAPDRRSGRGLHPERHLWNVTVTGHGILMMFFVVIGPSAARQLFHAARSARRTWPSTDEQPVLLFASRTRWRSPALFGQRRHLSRRLGRRWFGRGLGALPAASVKESLRWTWRCSPSTCPGPRRSSARSI